MQTAGFIKEFGDGKITGENIRENGGCKAGLNKWHHRYRGMEASAMNQINLLAFHSSLLRLRYSMPNQRIKASRMINFSTFELY